MNVMVMKKQLKEKVIIKNKRPFIDSSFVLRILL